MHVRLSIGRDRKKEIYVKAGFGEKDETKIDRLSALVASKQKCCRSVVDSDMPGMSSSLVCTSWLQDAQRSRSRM